MPHKKGLKVLNLKVENFKLFETLDVPINGNNVYLIGPNGSGKSTFIDAIYTALTGKDIPIKSIKEGHEKGKITVDIGNDDNKYTVELSFTEAKEKGYLKLKMDNFNSSSPRRDLDNIIGNIAFDPFEFIGLSGSAEGRRKQSQIIRDFLGVTFEDLDEKRKALFAERTTVNYSVDDNNRIIEDSELSDEDMSKYKDPVDIAEVSKQISDIREHNQKVEYVSNGINSKKETIESIDSSITELESQIETIKNQIKEKEERKQATQSDIDEGTIWMEQNEKKETTELEDKLSNASEHNQKVVEAEKLQKAIKDHKTSKQKSEQLTEQMQQLDKQKEERIKNADSPVEGLGFDAEGMVTIDGLPFDDNQIEKSRIIKVGVELLMAMDPALKIIRIKDGSLLDPARKKVIEELIQNNGYQAFIEFVSQDEKVDDLEIQLIEDLTDKK